MTDYSDEEMDRLILTTAPTVANQEIESELEIITAECVFGMNIFRDLFAGIRDIFGGRSTASQRVLKDARKTCLRELKIAAMEWAINAVPAPEAVDTKKRKEQENAKLKEFIQSPFLE